MRLLYTFFPLGLLLTLPLGAQQSVPLQEGTMLGLYHLNDEATPEDSDTKYSVDGFVHMLKGERGVHEGSDVMLWVSPDTTATTGWPLRQDPSYDRDVSTRYVIIDSGEPNDRNWLQEGVVFGLHEVQLKEDVNKAAFEKFVHTIWAPTRSDALPDSKVIFLKGIDGKRTGEYAYVWLLDSEDTRDYYFPASEEASQVFTDFEKGWSWLNDRQYLGKYLAEDGGDVFTDFVLVW